MSMVFISLCRISFYFLLLVPTKTVLSTLHATNHFNSNINFCVDIIKVNLQYFKKFLIHADILV